MIKNIKKAKRINLLVVSRNTYNVTMELKEKFYWKPINNQKTYLIRAKTRTHPVLQGSN